MGARGGQLMSLFFIGYGLSNILLTPLAARLGPRRALLLIVVLFSLFSALGAPLSSSLVLFGATRLAMGLGEGPHFPMMSALTRAWFPPGERSRANGLWIGGAVLATVITPLIVVPVIGAFGWRAMLVAVGLTGMLVTLPLLWLVVRDTPEQAPCCRGPRSIACARCGPRAPRPTRTRGRRTTAGRAWPSCAARLLAGGAGRLAQQLLRLRRPQLAAHLLRPRAAAGVRPAGDRRVVAILLGLLGVQPPRGWATARSGARWWQAPASSGRRCSCGPQPARPGSRSPWPASRWPCSARAPTPRRSSPWCSASCRAPPWPPARGSTTASPSSSRRPGHGGHRRRRLVDRQLRSGDARDRGGGARQRTSLDGAVAHTSLLTRRLCR